ncbi:MAG TPA: tetratricopeptide repeat protein, partial [Chloroflexia bacterium]|nr:tetratricopeptide repeat protein [Chloroflexia bacterium]
LLLVLDNCEHLIAACAQLAETLLLSCAGLRILASSREPLGIAGETTLRLPPLSFPDPNRLPAAAETLAAAQAAPAVQLFVDRASAVRPGFRLTEENAPTLIQICARLDGIPLALELAAARVSSLAVDVLAARLDDRFRLLTGGRRTALPRQQTLRALIDWSHTLLTADERVLFRRLAVFSGGWTLEAAEAVCDDGGWGLGAGGWDGSADPQPPIQNPQIPTPPIPNPPPPTPHPQLDILDLLIQLTNKSLIVVEEGEDATRYRLLETIRQYADEKLGDAGEAAAVRQRHRDWFLHFAETAAQQLQGAAQIAWMARLELEHDNLRAALAWCLTAPAGLQPGLRLAGALASFWGLRGYWHEGRHWLTSFLTHPGAAAPTAARAGALLGIATLTSDTTNSRRPLVESIAICRQLGDQPRLARALAHQGYVALNSGDYAEARALLRESQDLFRQTDDQRGLAECLYLLGRIALDQAQVPAAAALLEEGLARYRAAGDHEGLSACLLQLGRTLMLQGAYEAARGRFEESLALRRELGNWNGVLWALNNLGEAARAQGDYARAGTLYAESLQQAHAVGNKWGEAAVLHNLAYVALAAGDVPRARTYFADSLALADELGRKPGVAESLVGLGGVALAEHQPERALRLFAAADTLLAALGAHLDPPDQAEYDRHLRTVAAMLDSAAAARARAVGAGMPLAQAIAYALEG